MLRTISWYALGGAILFLTYPMLIISIFYSLRGKDIKKNILVNRTTSFISRALFYLTGSNIKVTGLENVPVQGAVLFVSNHQGHMDSLIIHGFINKPKGFISIVEVLKFSIIREWMELMNCVFLDRKDMRQSLSCINQAISNLSRGISMVVFPEGRLNDGEISLGFQKGWLRIVKKSGVPIIPIRIKGSYKVLSKDGSRVRAASVECVIFEPILLANQKELDENEFIYQLSNKIL